LTVLASAVLAAACTTEVHPEYHPVTSTTYVQNVTYASTTVVQLPPPLPAPRTRRQKGQDGEEEKNGPSRVPLPARVRYRAWTK
jgi:hypothetical protein